jgi:hypothetical protein
MTRATVAFIAVLILAAGTSLAQSPQPYAGLHNRALKALSDEQLDDLKAGRGIGLALAGELNGYPGPKHVLELAGELNLSDAQRMRAQQLFDEMKAEAIPLGEQIIAAEIDLDRQFSGRTVTPASLTAATTAIGATQGTLRRHAPEISPRDGERADARADRPIWRVARLWRRRTGRTFAGNAQS